MKKSRRASDESKSQVGADNVVTFPKAEVDPIGEAIKHGTAESYEIDPNARYGPSGDPWHALPGDGGPCAICGRLRENLKPVDPCGLCGKQLEDSP